jgi:hypothetical protein
MSPLMPQSLVLSTAKAAILALGPAFDTLLKIEQEQDFDNEVPVDWELVFTGFYKRFKSVRAQNTGAIACFVAANHSVQITI